MKKRIDYSNAYYYGDVDLNGKEHGQGELHFQDGSYMFGEWVHGRRQGHFEFYNNRGHMYYKGDYDADRGYHGKGTFIFDNGVKIIGDFVNGKPVYGIMMWPDSGDICSGDMEDWHLVGECILKRGNGEMWQTNWVNGECHYVFRIK